MSQTSLVAPEYLLLALAALMFAAAAWLIASACRSIAVTYSILVHLRRRD